MIRFHSVLGGVVVGIVFSMLQLSCQEANEPSPKVEIKIETQTDPVQKTDPETTSQPEIQKPIVQEKAFKSEEELSIQIDTSKINVVFSNFFRTDPARLILFNGLEPYIGGDVKITTYPPIYEERKKPRIVLTLSETQFAGLTPLGPEGMDTQRLIAVLQTLNQYRRHIAENSEQRIFHFWIAVEVQDCLFFPSDQEPFIDVTKIDHCVLHKEEKVCGEEKGQVIRNIPKACRTQK